MDYSENFSNDSITALYPEIPMECANNSDFSNDSITALYPEISLACANNSAFSKDSKTDVYTELPMVCASDSDFSKDSKTDVYTELPMVCATSDSDFSNDSKTELYTALPMTGADGVEDTVFPPDVLAETNMCMDFSNSAGKRKLSEETGHASSSVKRLRTPTDTSEGEKLLDDLLCKIVDEIGGLSPEKQQHPLTSPCNTPPLKDSSQSFLELLHSLGDIYEEDTPNIASSRIDDNETNVDSDAFKELVNILEHLQGDDEVQGDDIQSSKLCEESQLININDNSFDHMTSTASIQHINTAVQNAVINNVDNNSFDNSNTADDIISSQEFNNVINMISSLQGNVTSEPGCSHLHMSNQDNLCHDAVLAVPDVNHPTLVKMVVNTPDPSNTVYDSPHGIDHPQDSPRVGVHTPQQVGSGGGSDRSTDPTSHIPGSNVKGSNTESSNTTPAFTVRERMGRMNRRFNVREQLYTVTLHSRYLGQRWLDHLDALCTAFEHVLDRATHNLNDGDLVRLVINQTGLSNPIVLPLGPKTQMTVAEILKTIENVLQSNESIAFNESFEIICSIVAVPVGGRGKPIINLACDTKRKTSIVVIGNKDQQCCSRAIVVCHMKQQNNKDYTKIARRCSAKQTQMAIDLCKQAGVDTTKPTPLTEIYKFEKVLNTHIRVVSGDNMNEFIYTSSGVAVGDKCLYIYYHDNHYDAIVNIKAFYGAQYFCEYCCKPFNKLDVHRCPAKCDLCHRFNCNGLSDAPRGCKRCNQTCGNDMCFQKHHERKVDPITGLLCDSVCDKYWKCTQCKHVISRSRKSKHRCGEKFCTTCEIYYMDDEHQCFITPRPSKPPSFKYIFFDFECQQSTGIHAPNFCVAHRVCQTCIDVEDISIPCTACGQREFIFRGPETQQEFCTWLFSSAHQGFTAMAHNLGGYDSMFLLNYLIKNTVKPEVIFKGSKAMYIRVAGYNITVIDSLNHMPMSLAKLPTAFGIECLKKGYFPHFFNTPENQDYIGCLPDPDCYGVDSFQPEARNTFLNWYSEQKQLNVVFDFQKEIEAYCRNDVDVLRRSALKFRRLILHLSERPVQGREPHGVDPFNYLTLASVCFTLFRHSFLKPNVMARVPAEGITCGQFSRESIVWLDYLMYKARKDGKDLHIQHGMNGREKMIGHYRVDGFDSSTKTIYTYLGCFHHGHKCKFAPDTVNPKSGVTMGVLHAKTMARQELLKKWGYKIISKYACEFHKDLETDEDLKRFHSEHDMPSRLDPKDAFFGGRVNATRLFYEIKPGEEIHYVDFTSLYPAANKVGRYPLGYPEVITSDFKPMTQYFGLAKVKILPPRGLYHPVLPYKANGKLMFPLCRTCCINQQVHCNHSNEDRALTGTFVTLELHKALELGYTILKVYEVYHFPKTIVYDPDTNTPGLFSDYINALLKLKQEASGWPAWVKTEADKLKYIQDYKEHEGITLDYDNIVKNPGLRSCSKMGLNSLWGKSGQRSNLTQSKFITNVSEFYDLFFDDSKILKGVHIITDTVVLVEWVYEGEFSKTVASSNVYVAAFTTAMARLKLYSLLELAGENTLYFDTDSLLFIRTPEGPTLPLGDFLGELTNELPPGEFGTAFVSGGCKNYALVTNKGTEMCKVRGFSLNYKNSQIINFDTVLGMVQNIHTVICTCQPRVVCCKKCSPYLRVTDQKICRDVKALKIYNRVENKDYRVCYDKRVILDDLNTLPYGY